MGIKSIIIKDIMISSSKYQDFREKYISKLPDFLPNLLIRYDALISGGSFASVLVDEPVNDYDIYINIYYARKFIKQLLKEGFKIKRYETIDAYAEDFLLRNRILFRTVLENNDIDYDIIVTDKNPRHVVCNFDITCCEVWFDGRDINGTYFDCFMNKIGYVKPIYIGDRSRVQVERQNKYISRGFEIISNDIVPKKRNYNVSTKLEYPIENILKDLEIFMVYDAPHLTK